MNWRMFIIVVLASLFCREVKASDDHDTHGSVHFGPTGQVKATPHALAASLGAFSAFNLGGKDTEIHTCAWVNVAGALGGGAGGGTLHRGWSKVWVGWELSLEYEAQKTKELWFLGVGPVLEVQAEEHTLLFLKVPVGLEFFHQHNQVGWAVQAGIHIPIGD